MVKNLFYTAWSLMTATDYKRQFTLTKPTQTDRKLDQSSYNPSSYKVTTTQTRRAQLICDSPDRLQDETDYLNNAFSKKHL